MLQAFFNGLSGLFSFSKGLDNVSNNVSNMNTPGYRGSDTFYRSVNGQGGDGIGAKVAGTEVRVKPGEARQTGNSMNAAVDGNGYFVLRDENGNFFYTRAGQFQVDKEGYLVDSVSQRRVAGISASGKLQDLNINPFRTLPPKPTTRVEMVGALARSGPTDSTHKISSVQVYDSAGNRHALTVEFKPQQVPLNSWEVSISDDQGVVQTGSISFGVDGTPVAGFNTITVLMRNSGQQVVLDFGTPGSFNLASQVASAPSHTLSAKVMDGSATASLSSFAFDEKGVIQFAYSNGEKRGGDKLALASFSDETALIADSSMYRTPPTMRADYGQAGENHFGSIRGGYLELSNVDLSQEFGDILIIQRGYQASSRVMTVSNELLEQLYNGTRGG